MLATPMVQGVSFAQDVIKGSVIKSEDQPTNAIINHDDIVEIPEKTQLDLVLSTPLTTNISAEGDEFFAKLPKDIKVDGKIVIPHGSVVHGTVSEVEGPKRAGRKAWVETKFDYLITPDGREIPIEGGYTSRDKKLKAAAKVVGRAAGYTLVGGALGALAVVKYGGLAAVAATEGYALAGGAAVGGAAGLTWAMVKKGKNTMIPPGSEISIKLSEPLQLPSMNISQEDTNYSIPGLNVNVIGMNVSKDAFGTLNEVNLTLEVENFTANTFSSFEIALEDEYGNQFYPSPFGDTGMWFRKLTPNTHIKSNITFNVDDPHRALSLVFFKQYTREPIAKFALTDSMAKDKKEYKKLKKAYK